MPVHWQSEDVDGLACGAVNNNYYPANPCRLAVRARLRSSSATDQVRNVLYLQGDHGAGPVSWKVVDLREGITIPAGGSPIFDSDDTGDVLGLTGHPCVRTYILPPAFRPDFPRSSILSIASVADLNAMVVAYGIQDQHWAQQNISRQAEEETCPNADCRVVKRYGPAIDHYAAFDVPAALFDALAGAPALAQHAEAPAAAKPPAGAPILLPAEKLRQYGRDHVIVQVTARGYRSATVKQTPRYNFIEQVGGITQLIPAERLAKGGVPLQFQVGNPAEVPRHLGLQVAVQVPPGTPPVQVALDTRPRVYAPFETRLQQGKVRRATGDESAGDGKPQPPGNRLLLVIFLLCIAAVVLLVRFLAKPGSE
jgi:hypothetical protein